MPKSSLGRGLGALLPEALKSFPDPSPFMKIGVEELFPNQFQPRQDFNEEEQAKLTASIKKSGIIQPIVVRKSDQGYEIIAGERRWRAAQAAGLREVPVMVRTASDIDVAELSLVENIIRENLGPLEEAQAFQTLVDKFNVSHDEIAHRLGKDRSTVTNTLRLLKLPDPVKKALQEKKITAGHARALLSLDSTERQNEVLGEIIRKNLSVRETESLVNRKGNNISLPSAPDPDLVDLEKEIEKILMLPVKIKKGTKISKIEISFRNSKELDTFFSLVSSRADR